MTDFSVKAVRDSETGPKNENLKNRRNGRILVISKLVNGAETPLLVAMIG